MESYGNKLASGELFAIQYTHILDVKKTRFYVDPFKRQKYVTVPMSTVSIQNIYIKFWTHKSEFPLVNYLCSLTKTKITRQRTFELMGIEYDQIKDEIARMGLVDYNTYIVIKNLYFDDIEDLKRFSGLNM